MPIQPHILIFNPDQWRGDVMGHMGDPAAVTPNLDHLVETDAVSFRVAACQNTVCTPSRCSFMTGWYPHIRGHRTMHHMLRDHEGDPNLLRVLRDNGYYVWWGGKNDLVPGQFGYEKDCDVKYQPARRPKAMWMTDHQDEWRKEPGSDSYYSFYVGRLDTGDEEIYYDGDWANVLGAIDFIKNAPEDKPLCIYRPLTYPHPPYGVEDPWYSLIDRDSVPQRAPTPENWDEKSSLLKAIYETQNLQGWTEERWQELRAVYYGMCARLDHQFGLLMDALKDAEIYDDTAVFVFADHGDYTGDYGIVEKTQNTFEDALSRVPFIIKPPKDVPVQPRVSEALVELIDFPATVYDLAGIEPGYWHFGQTLLPVLAGETDAHRDAIFCEGGRLQGETQAMEGASVTTMDDPSESLYWPRIKHQISDDQPWHTKATMCRTHDFKYIRRLYEHDELYDLGNDPQETRNLIDDPTYAEILLQLKERMLTWYMATADIVPFELDRRR
ncbi:MAG: sulfatase-like hydrolase/transferase [Anaerolineae bacterium]|nr:sulfatase-like hydrolase/transferase [Anaerolineae bacterium]